MSSDDAITPLKRARQALGMSQVEVCVQLRAERKRRGTGPPKLAHVKRMYTDWELGRVTPTEWRDELCAVLEQPPEALWPPPIVASAPESAARLPSPTDVAQPDGSIVPSVVQAPEPRMSLAEWLSGTNTSDEVIARLDQAAVSIAEAHTQIPPQRALNEVMRLHSETERLLRGGRHRLRQTRELARIDSDLLAHICLLLGDLGRNEKALPYGEVSLLCAQEAGSSEAKAWTVQAKTARWQGRYVEAADLASRGFACSAPEPIRVQLAYQEANAAALLGDARRAQQAVERAEHAADEQRADDSGVSAWSFPGAR